MRTIRLGRTNLSVSAVGLGGIQFSKISAAAVARIIAAARDEGINFLETAYGYFDSEEKTGKALRGKRGKWIIASKNWQTDGREFTRCLDESLKRLRVDYFDIYQLHGVDSAATLRERCAPDAAMDAARKAKDAGKVRSLGLTSHSLDTVLHVLKRHPGLFDTIQYPISLVNTEVPRSGILGLARRADIGLIAMKPLGGGRLGDARLALGYVYQFAGVVPVVGVETPEQVRELAGLADRPPRLSARDRVAIRRLRTSVGAGFCRACRYCEPCPQGISIFQMMYVPVYFKQMGARRLLRDGIPAYIDKARSCTACRACEGRCPFHLKIVEGVRAGIKLTEEMMASL
jgi:predicted aldo/keto reductase-like oxidoreductase